VKDFITNFLLIEGIYLIAIAAQAKTPLGIMICLVIGGLSFFGGLELKLKDK